MLSSIQRMLLLELSRNRKRLDVLKNGEVYSYIEESKNRNELIRLSLKIKEILPGLDIYIFDLHKKYVNKKPLFQLYANYLDYGREYKPISDKEKKRVMEEVRNTAWRERI